MRLKIQEPSELNFVSRIIPPQAEDIVDILGAKQHSTRSVRGIVRPKLHKRNEMKFIGRTILRPKGCKDNPANP